MIGSLEEIVQAIKTDGYEVEGLIGRDQFYTLDAWMDDDVTLWEITKAERAAEVI